MSTAKSLGYQDTGGAGAVLGPQPKLGYGTLLCTNKGITSDLKSIRNQSLQ